ncbi:MAG: hypothetical protein M3Q65_08590 [Chloroflexota bacterium]|nr:hypothetical protein [Chloroflexota bacterium]
MVATLAESIESFHFSPPLFAAAISSPREAVETITAVKRDPVRDWLLKELSFRDRPLLPEEQEAITTLLAIWQSKLVQRTWSDVSFGVNLTQARHMLSLCANGGVIGLGLEGQGGLLSLFGRYIALGRERLVYFQVQLANQSAVRASLTKQRQDTATTLLQFRPFVNNTVEDLYFDSPRLLEPSNPEDVAAIPEQVRDFNQYRPGRWRIHTTPRLHAPIEIGPVPETQPSGWRLDIPERIGAKFAQLDHIERESVLSLLWAIQRRGGRRYLDEQAVRVGEAEAALYVLRPTTDLRVVLRPLSTEVMRVAEIVYTETLRMFREQQ